MKKSVFVLAGLALVMASCTNDDITPAAGGDGAVTFTVNVPVNTMSRAYSEGTSAGTLTYAAYETGSKEAVLIGTATPAADRRFDVKMNLVKGKSYDFVFGQTRVATHRPTPLMRRHKASQWHMTALSLTMTRATRSSARFRI